MADYYIFYSSLNSTAFFNKRGKNMDREEWEVRLYEDIRAKYILSGSIIVVTIAYILVKLMVSF